MQEFQHEAFKPKLDRTLRLRAIRRLQAAKAPAPPEKKSKSRARKPKAAATAKLTTPVKPAPVKPAPAKPVAKP